MKSTGSAPSSTTASRPPWRRWVRRAFVTWAILSTGWMFNSFRTQGVGANHLTSDGTVTVRSSGDALVFMPASAASSAGLLFITGGGVAAEAYAPLLRPIAARGHPVHIVRLPYRLAPLDSHKETALARARTVLRGGQPVKQWVIAGHSLGAALACRLASEGAPFAGLVLIGTSHPKTNDLSRIRMPVTKVFGSNDGVATPAAIHQNEHLLPPNTRWVEIAGGNHSQFGHYGHQLFDGTASITREQQQARARAALLDALQRVI